MKEVPVIEKKKDDTLPYAIFFDSVQEICSDFGAEEVIKALRVAQQKFQFTEQQFRRFLYSMNNKIPQIEKTIETIEYLVKSE